jgi:predicted nucleic acid-binding protein
MKPVARTGGLRAVRFLDTNVLLYLLSSEPTKADRAEGLISAGAVISIQVLSEFTAVARRKLSLEWREIDEILAVVRGICRVEAVTIDTYDHARALAERHRLSWYDAMIAASAMEAGCRTLYSEDFQHGFVIDRKLKVVNPFV